MSILAEKSSIEYTMQSLGFHVNRRSDAQQFVDTRDKCAHASGFIQYNERDVENHFIKVLDYMGQISDKNKSSVQNMFELTLKEFWVSDSFSRLSSAEKAAKMISQLKLSAIDISYILQIDKARIFSGFPESSYMISFIILMTVFIINSSTRDGSTSVDLNDGYLQEELSAYLLPLSSEDFSKIEIELEDEMNALEQAYGTMSYAEFIKLREKVA